MNGMVLISLAGVYGFSFLGIIYSYFNIHRFEDDRFFKIFQYFLIGLFVFVIVATTIGMINYLGVWSEI